MLDLRPSYGSPDVYFIKCCYRSDPEIESQWFDSSQGARLQELGPRVGRLICEAHL